MRDEEGADEREERANAERELQKKYGEDQLSSGEANSFKVFVLELMMILPGRCRFNKTDCREQNKEYWSFIVPIIEAVERLSHRAYRSPLIIEDDVFQRFVAVVAENHALKDLGLSDECVWLREVDAEELFEAKDRWLLLQADQIREIESEFVLDALKDKLVSKCTDARLAVLQAARELLMEHLEDDLWLIPNGYLDVVEAIDVVLSRQDWFHLTAEKVRNLDSEVIEQVPMC